MVKFENILNPLILADKMVGFHGNSEFFDSDGNLQMGYWTFVGIIKDEDVPALDEQYGVFSLDDEIEDELVFNQELMFPVWDAKKEFVCAVQFHYRSDDDE